MNEAISIKYLVMKKEMLDANDALEGALKKIADIFRNIQATSSSLIDDNKRLELMIEKLNEKSYNCTCAKEQNRGSQSTKCSKTEQAEKERDLVGICDDGETQGIIESTQIEGRKLIKQKDRNMEKRSESQMNQNKFNDANKFIGTQSNRKKQSRGVRVSAELVILTRSECSQRFENSTQAAVKKSDGNISGNRMNDAELDPQDLDIDATLFEQPFSQEKGPDEKSPIVGNTDNIENSKENLNTSPVRSLLDDVVEVSPKKNILRKKNWLRHNRPTVKCREQNSSADLVKTSNADIDDREMCTRKSLECSTAKETKEERTPRSKTNTFSSRVSKRNLSLALMKEATSGSPSPIEVTASTIKAKLNIQSCTGVENDDRIDVKILPKTLSGEATSDETYFAVDEMNNSEQKIAQEQDYAQSREKNMNTAKRKFSDLTTPPEMEKNINPTFTELELDIGDMSDWDTDISDDKWFSNTPQKRALINSFDRVPVKKEIAPNFAVKGPVVRNKAQRAKLRGWDCENCAKYYENIGLSEKQLAKRKNQCSRHRSKFNERYLTPPGLWDLRFPDTQTSSQD